ncbi:MAG: LL-diaminopimelate aminotransferase [Clostridia bacterium]|nr:LL-diaminopimelate aminotransferase [Clostridia bacterium]
MDFFTDKISERLGGLEFEKSTAIYKFARIKRAKEEAKSKHPELPLIDMGVGEPDLPADVGVVSVLAEEAGKGENRFYSDNGIPEFQEAAATYLKKVYKLQGIDPGRNIIHGIGSKPILAMIPLVFINPGDIALTTIPGYPVLATYTKYLGGEVYNLPLLKENSFYPDFKGIPQNVLKRAKLLYINYPNNPTGQAATKEFYQEVVEFAYKNNIVVIADSAYGAITYDGLEPLSFLSIEGAMDVGMEVHSLSKAFNMTGWRIGFIASNEKAIRAFSTVKDNTDSGQFRAIQKAAIYALNHPELTQKNNERYSRRMELLINALREIGFDAQKPKSTFYCYVPCPKGTKSGMKFSSADEFSEFLIKEALISTVPWDEAGRYIRFSVTYEADSFEMERKRMEELKNRLGKLDLIF